MYHVPPHIPSARNIPSLIMPFWLKRGVGAVPPTRAKLARVVGSINQCKSNNADGRLPSKGEFESLATGRNHFLLPRESETCPLQQAIGGLRTGCGGDAILASGLVWPLQNPKWPTSYTQQRQEKETDNQLAYTYMIGFPSNRQGLCNCLVLPY